MRAHERTVGDLLDPTRPGSVTASVNAVTRGAGVDAAAWPWVRVLSLLAQLEAEGEARGRANG